MDFAKLQKMQKKSREEEYILSDDDAEKQIFEFVNYYDIDLTFDIDGLMDEEVQNELAQMTDKEKEANTGIKQILKDVGNWIRRGVLSIEYDNDKKLIIKHDLIESIGEKSEKSEPITNLVYRSVMPKDTEKLSGLPAEKYTFSQRAELLMAWLSDNPVSIIDRMGTKDKRAARSVGLLLLIAL